MTERKQTSDDSKQKESDEIAVNYIDSSGSTEPSPTDGGHIDRADEAKEETLESPEQRIAELEDRVLRTVAEFDNYRKRTGRQHQELIRNANERLLLDMLEVVDNFERALQHVENVVNDDSLQRGAELIYAQMTDLLSRYEVKPIEAVGNTFDPNLHEAVMKVDSDEHPEGVVTMEISRGYTIGDRVLRHSKVGVSSGNASVGTTDGNVESD